MMEVPRKGRWTMKIGEIIREKRKEQSLTQEQLANLLGVSATAVHKWEKGTTYPDITTLPVLTRMLKPTSTPCCPSTRI